MKLTSITGLNPMLAGALVAAIFMAQATPALAADDGLYLSGAGGLTWHEDSDINGTGVNTTADFDKGFAAAAALGYRVGNGFRPELELSFRRNDIDNLTGATTAVSGRVNSWTTFANVFYDIDLNAPITPFLGAGLGIMRLNAEGATPIGTGLVNDTDMIPVVQFVGGAAYAMTDHMDLFADYRYIHGLTDAKFGTSAGVKVDAEVASHSIMVGFRWNFGGPDAQPTAEPAPAPTPVSATPAPAAIPRDFIVFFDWDEAVLTNEAATIVDSAAGYAKAGRIVRIELTGHADRSGTQRYNLGLSQRRAEAVRKALVARGLNSSEIALTWKGETEPLVQTGDGVREPQNRRVHIVFP